MQNNKGLLKKRELQKRKEKQNKIGLLRSSVKQKKIVSQKRNLNKRRN